MCLVRKVSPREGQWFPTVAQQVRSRCGVSSPVSLVQGMYLHYLGGSPSFGEHQKAEGWGGRAGSRSPCVGPIPFWSSPAACSEMTVSLGRPFCHTQPKPGASQEWEGAHWPWELLSSQQILFCSPIQCSWFVSQLWGPPLPSEQWPYCSELPSRYREGRRHRPHWPAAGSVVTSLFPPIRGLSQSIHAGRVKAIMFPSLPWRGKKSLSEATLTQQGGAGACDFLLVISSLKG